MAKNIGFLRNLSKGGGKTDYSRTIFLPKTKFPSHHEPKTELKIQQDARFSQAYMEQNQSRTPYIVHDGPPFANGQIHIGHAVNKILKDIAARYAMITGHKVEFITGWDCHGLPIELQVIKILEEQELKGNYGGSMLLDQAYFPDQFRARARTYAKSQIDLQLASFKRIGLLTDWNKRYTTDDPSYVATQLRAFSQMFEQKLIFKDLMPINWSVVNRNTVADIDLEHREDHISKVAYVLFEMLNNPDSIDCGGHPLYSVIWTTTPWTLLENQAIAFNKQETYCTLKIFKDSSPMDVKYILISLDAVHGFVNVLNRLGYQFEYKNYLPGKSLTGLKYKPLLDSLLPDDLPNKASYSSPRPFIDAEFVEGTKGTGLVHIAPNYGHDDFYLMTKNKFRINKCLIDESGKYDMQIEELGGKQIFLDGNQKMIELLDNRQALLLSEHFQHSYPYETRTNHPIMIRCSRQIFLDTSRIIPRCLKALNEASFFPENRRPQFINTLKSSPNWCMSRQRLWGTPIPVFYHVTDTAKEKMITHPLMIEHFCKLLYKRRFMDYWWNIDNSELIPQELLDKCKLPYNSEDLIRGLDIFDVWSDSGLSWHTTIDSLNDSKHQADIYLEGIDQIRGWFLASSLSSVALRGVLPTKRFYLHGFTMDENGYKMSKSQGNVVDPIQLFEKYGVDPVRLWVAKNAGNHNNIRVKQRDFEKSVNEVIKQFRVTLRYLIGALEDHDAVEPQFEHTKLDLFDQYYLDKLYRLGATIDEHYKNYRYDSVLATMYKFIQDEFSPVYLHTIKDSLYCDTAESAQRKSKLVVLNLSYNIFIRCLYPLIPHTVHEAGDYMRASEPLNEWQNLGHKASWKNDVLHDQFERLIKIRSFLQKILASKFDQCRDRDMILFVNDKKLFKTLTKITNSDPELMSELFKCSNFVLNLNEKLTTPADHLIIDVEPEHPEAQKFDSKLLCDNPSQPNATADGQPLIENNSLVNLKLLNYWIYEGDDQVRLGGLIKIGDSNQSLFEVNYRKSDQCKCPRCRRFQIIDSQQQDLCDRCSKALQSYLVG